MPAARTNHCARRVLLVNGAQTGGGAGRVGELLADGLRRARVDVRAFVRGSCNRESRESPAGHWRETRVARRLARHGFTDLAHPSSFLWRCRAEYAAADVLHLHNLHGDYVSLAALPLWGFQKPLVWTLHDCWLVTGNCATPRSCERWRHHCGRCPLRGVYPMGPVDRSRFYRALKPGLIRAARPVLVSPSRWLADRVVDLREFRGLTVRVIPNPVGREFLVRPPEPAALRGRFGLRRDRVTIVLAGADWSDPLKGGSHAIAALRRAGARLGAAQLLVVGTAGDRLRAASGLPGRALPFLCDRNELALAYACADVCLFPSLAENYPLTTLEAMACGTPVVAYGVGGIAEQVEHGVSGHVARAGVSEDLAQGLIRFCEDRELARRTGRAARSFVTRTCDPDAVTRSYRSIYRDAIRRWCQRRHRAPRTTRGRLAHWLAGALCWETDAPPVPLPDYVPTEQPLLEGAG